MELTSNYKHNKLAWHELGEYYLTLINYENTKQVMMQQTPSQQAERKAYEEYINAGGVE